MDKEILNKIGLSDGEAEVYLALLPLDFALASEIAAKTHFHRTNIYDFLDSLIKKGLVSYIIKSGKRYFKAADPEKLIDFLREKEEFITKFMPELKKLQLPKKAEPKVEVYRGKEGLKSILEDILRERKTQYVYGSVTDIKKCLEFYFPYFIKRRIKLGMKLKIILDKNPESEKRKKLALTKVKFIPEKYKSQILTIIYGNKVAIFVWTDDPLVILIESENIMKGYKTYFDFLWKIATS